MASPAGEKYQENLQLGVSLNLGTQREATLSAVM